MKKLYPSSIYPVTGVTTAGYKESCPRFFAMKSQVEVPKNDIPDLYMAMGRVIEAKTQAQLEALGPRYKIMREVPVKHSPKPGWEISGRVDFLVEDLIDPELTEIWEVKSSLSKKKKASIIGKGQVDVAHIGQLLTYMMIMQVKIGKYSFNFVQYDHKDDALKFINRTFKVELQNTDVYIDGEKWEQYNLTNYLQFYKLMINSVEQPDLPAKSTSYWACKSCPFSNVCNRNPITKAAFVSLYELFGESIVSSMPEPKF